MAESMTYQSLIQDLQTYCERSDAPFIDQCPRFIMLAENRLASEVRGLGFLRSVQTVLNGPNLVKPARWRETKSFAIMAGGEVTYLQSRSYQYCTAFNPTGASGVPRYYSDEIYEYWFISPNPLLAYDAQIMYHERPEPLDAINSVSWTTQYAPQLILYASLMEAMPFLKTSERLPEFQGLYDRALLALGKEDEKRQRPDAAAVRS